MSYPNFGNDKILTIPMEKSFLSVYDEKSFAEFASNFKERYGIDLTEIIKTSDGSIFLEYNGLVLLKVYKESDGNFPVGHTIPYFRSPIDKTWSQDSGDGKLFIMITDQSANALGYGFYIEISKSSDFDLENAKVHYYEI